MLLHKALILVTIDTEYHNLGINFRDHTENLNQKVIFSLLMNWNKKVVVDFKLKKKYLWKNDTRSKWSQVWPSGQSSCAFADVPSTCRWEASGCRCGRWSPCAWRPQPAVDRWHYSSSSTRRSTASWPSVHPAYKTDQATQQPADQTPWGKNIMEYLDMTFIYIITQSRIN